MVSLKVSIIFTNTYTLLTILSAVCSKSQKYRDFIWLLFTEMEILAFKNITLCQKSPGTVGNILARRIMILITYCDGHSIKNANLEESSLNLTNALYFF